MKTAFSKCLVLTALAVTAATAGLVATDARATTDAGEAEEGTGFDLSNLWFIEPLPGAEYAEAPATFDVVIGIYQGFDDQEISTVELSIDNMLIGTEACLEGCTFADVELGQGVHDLVVRSDTGYERATVVYVDEEPRETGESGDTESGDTESGDTESGDTESGDTESGDGDTESSSSGSGSSDADTGSSGGAELGPRGCSVYDGPMSPWGLLALPALLLLPGFRRRD